MADQLRDIVSRMVEAGESESDIAAVIQRLSAKPSPKPQERSMLATAKDVAIGAAKSVPETIFGLGKVVRDYTPIGRISDLIQPGAFEQKLPEITPSNPAQQAGMTIGQIGQFFVPGAGATRLARAAGEVAKSGALTLGQTGGDVAAAGASAALAGALPAAGAATRASRALRGSAEKSVQQALGATKEWAKSEAAKLAPEMLRRGVRGSRQSMLERAQANARTTAKAIDDEVSRLAQTGSTVDARVIVDALGKAKDEFIINGRPIEGAQKIVRQLNALENFVANASPWGWAIPIENAQKIKRTWDRIVSKSGLYGQKAGASATDNAAAWTIREAATAFRKELASASPQLDKLNKDYAFWGGLRKVLTETERRTGSQGGGLVSGVAGVGGASAALASGGDFSDIALAGLAGRQVVKVLQSPYWRTAVSAPLKNLLADALASGNAARVERASRKIINALPAQVQLAMAQ